MSLSICQASQVHHWHSVWLTISNTWIPQVLVSTWIRIDGSNTKAAETATLSVRHRWSRVHGLKPSSMNCSRVILRAWKRRADLVIRWWSPVTSTMVDCIVTDVCRYAFCVHPIRKVLYGVVDHAIEVLFSTKIWSCSTMASLKPVGLHHSSQFHHYCPIEFWIDHDLTISDWCHLCITIHAFIQWDPPHLCTSTTQHSCLSHCSQSLLPSLSNTHYTLIRALAIPIIINDC